MNSDQSRLWNSVPAGRPSCASEITSDPYVASCIFVRIDPYMKIPLGEVDPDNLYSTLVADGV